MPKSDASKRILALRPGRRELGVAVLEHEDLIAWKVANFRQTHLPLLLNDMKARLHGFIQFYQPSVMVIEQVSQKRQRVSPYLDAVTAIVEIAALETHTAFQCFDQKKIRCQLCGCDGATGKDVVRRIVSAYPAMGRYACWTSSWQACYWMPMFSAIAAGLVCLRKIPHLATRH